MLKINITNFENNDRIMYDYLGQDIDLKIYNGVCTIETRNSYVYEILLHIFCTIPTTLYCNKDVKGLKFALNNNIKIAYRKGR